MPIKSFGLKKKPFKQGTFLFTDGDPGPEKKNPHWKDQSAKALSTADQATETALLETATET